jgi:DNA-binding NtrC family response regulator
MTDKPRVIVVDDEIILLLDLTDQLNEAGYSAQPVTTARGALSLIDHSTEALVTDIELPGNYSGLKLAKLAAKLHPGLPIVVVSGGVTPAADELPPGAVFIPKPYRVEAVLSAISRQRSARAA